LRLAQRDGPSRWGSRPLGRQSRPELRSPRRTGALADLRGVQRGHRGPHGLGGRRASPLACDLDPHRLRARHRLHGPSRRDRLTTLPAFLLGFALTLPAVLIHLGTNPTDLESVTRNELRIIQLGIAAGLSTAVGLAPVLWPMLPLAVLGYVAHLAVVSPPAELGRAWRRA